MTSTNSPLDYEAPITELEKRIEDLENFQRKSGVDVSDQITKLKADCDTKIREIYSGLSPWQRVQLARVPTRPELSDYLALCFEDVLELHGDRAIGDDPAMFTGMARIGTRRLMLIAHRKGKSTKERMEYNFGMPHPEGYRKALEKMKLAEKFHLPIVTLVNTPGAYPGIGAEERGQATIIARNLMDMAGLKTPIVSVVIGEGGSGGALGICVADRLAILENAYLSVISPEGCAAILWKDAAKAPEAAQLLRMTPGDLKKLGIIDDIVPEPLGGAHRNPRGAADALREYLDRSLATLAALPIDTLLDQRYAKHRKMGVYLEGSSSERRT